MSELKKDKVGRLGEEAACEYLISKGYSVLDKNVFVGKLEIDIVAHHKGQLVVVEVKSNRSNSPISGFENLTRDKVRNIYMASRTLSKLMKWSGEVRVIGILCVFLDESFTRLKIKVLDPLL